MHNLLTDDLITVTQPDGTPTPRTLPGVLADIMTGAATDFPSLWPHHSHPWQAFLVQLAAIATENAGLPAPPQDEAAWRTIISDLTPDHPGHEPWHLIVPDPMVPAFLQPPVRKPAQFHHYNKTSPTPDSIDLLFPSDNHDVKRFMVTDAEPQAWIFALIATQTFNGYGGSRTYGVSRMNSSSGNRPGISLAPHTGTPAANIRRDLIALLEFLPELRYNYPRLSDRPDATSLFWLIPWDGSKTDQIELYGLHPLYIEVCRRIRLVSKPNGITALRASSKNPRVADAVENRGITGDPWTPINISEEPKSLTIPKGGFSYHHLVNHLFSKDWTPPLLAKPTHDEAESPDPMILHAKALVRGKCKTEGYYERRILIRPTLKRSLRHPEERLVAQELAADLSKDISKVRKILSDALKKFNAHGKPDGKGSATPASNKFIHQFDRLVDRDFFPGLQDILEAETPQQQAQARQTWLTDGSSGLLDKARHTLNTAVNTLPTPIIRRRLAQDEARTHFESRLRQKNGFPSAFDNQPTVDTSQKQYDPPPPDYQLPPEGPHLLAPALAGYISQLATHRRSHFAQLRRMDTGNPESPAFNAIVKRYQLDLDPDGARARWAYIIKCLAVVTPSTSDDSPNQPETAHNPLLPIGRALHNGRDTNRTHPFYSEAKLQTLLNSSEHLLMLQLHNAVTLLAKNGISIDWREIIALVLAQGTNQSTAEAVKNAIATDYYRARSRSATNARKR